MESRFILLASVGLIVLAPNPLTWCIVDWRLLDDEDGVCVRCVLPAARAWLSGVRVAGLKKPCCCFEGACIDFALADLAAGGTFCASDPVEILATIVRRLAWLPWLKEGVRPMRPWTLSVTSFGTSKRASRDSRPDGSKPGPIDFRGARAAGFGGGWEENWLWRRLRMDTFVAGGGILAEADILLAAVALSGLLD